MNKTERAVLTTILVTLMTTTALFIGLDSTEKAHAAQPPLRRETVILHGMQSWYRTTEGEIQYTGFVLQNVSASTGAPQFENPGATQVAEAIAQLMTEGYKLERVEGGGLLVYMIK